MRRKRIAGLAAIIALATAVVACMDLARIDRRIDHLVKERSSELGESTIAPDVRARPNAMVESTESLYERQPDSRNPDPTDLEYRGLPADRDVLSRLDGYAAEPIDTLTLDLQEVWRITLSSAREYLNAEEEYLLAAIRLLVERHLWGPRFFDDLSVRFDGLEGPGGNYQSAMRVINDLRITQRLPYGGSIEAGLVTRAARQLTGVLGDENSSSAQILLSADIPLLRGAGRIAQEDLIQANRDLIYAARDFEAFRRDFLVQIARDYFNLLATQRAIVNQEERLQSVIEFQRRTEALVAAGRQAPFSASNVEQNVLTSRNSLINTRDRYILELDRFKIRLGMPVETPIRLEPLRIELQDPDVTVSGAARFALDFRLDLQNETDRLEDTKRGVRNARNQILPDLDINASGTIATDPTFDEAGFNFDFENTGYSAGVTFGLPLDREIERLQLRTALINLERQRRNLDQFRDNVILEARAAVREIDRARFSIRLQEQAVRINERRIEELTIREAEITEQQRLDAENELLLSRNDRDIAIRDLRNAILDFLVVTGQLRVAPDGTLLPLSGMVFEILEEVDGVDPNLEGPPPPPGAGAIPTPDGVSLPPDPP